MEELLSNVATGVWALISSYVAIKFIRSIRIVLTAKVMLLRLTVTMRPGGRVSISVFPLLIRWLLFKISRKLSRSPPRMFYEDNVRVEVDGVLYISVTSSENASYGVQITAMPPESWLKPQPGR